MIITVSDVAAVASVERKLAEMGLWVERHESSLSGLSIVQYVVKSHSAAVSDSAVRQIPGVSSVASTKSPHPRLDAMDRAIPVGDHLIGPGQAPVLMAGPCAIESESQIFASAEMAHRAGATFLRGGAYKPRTSPYAFQGHGKQALKWLRAAADEFGLVPVTEVLSERDAALAAEFAELIQIGARNMHSTAILRAIGQEKRPVLLKRGLSATIEEWMLAAEYLLLSGAPGVIFCERGIRSFDVSTRNVLDLGAVALLSNVYQLPIVVDPSHAAGRRDLVAPLSRAALAAGAHGLLVETHPDPASAQSDGPQALRDGELKDLGELFSKRASACAQSTSAPAKRRASYGQ